MVPYHGGALLPAEQRYTSPIFRRLHRIYRAEWLSLEEAAELVGFIRLVGFKPATVIFQWDKWQARQARRLMRHAPVLAASEAYWLANQECLDEETGLAVLQAMIDGGWKKGKPPEIVAQSFRSLRGRGLSAAKIAEMFPVMSQYRIQDTMTRRKPRNSARSAAVASLVVAGR